MAALNEREAIRILRELTPESLEQLLVLQNQFNQILSATLEVNRFKKHVPHLGMSCQAYEALLEEARTKLPQTGQVG